jgi:hypothetical protein
MYCLLITLFSKPMLQRLQSESVQINTSKCISLHQLDEPYLVQHNFKVSIRLQDNTKAMKQINSDVFVGVSPRKRSAIFYLSWINNKSTSSPRGSTASICHNDLVDPYGISLSQMTMYMFHFQ